MYITTTMKLSKLDGLLLNLCLIISAVTLATGHQHSPIDDYGALICRKCGHDIMSGDALIPRITTTKAVGKRNMTILDHRGVLVQVFENPAGEIFEVITAQAANVDTSGETYSEHSWFPGYTWTAAICPKCQHHLGWVFESTKYVGDTVKKESFVGLVLDYLISDSYADSLLMMPKLKII